MKMKQMLRVILGCVAVGTLVLASGPAQAQTTANGPYYATPSWDQKLQCDTLTTCPRFIVLSNWNSEAVLDRETGLVWERSPGDTNGDGVVDPLDRKTGLGRGLTAWTRWRSAVGRGGGCPR